MDDAVNDDDNENNKDDDDEGRRENGQKSLQLRWARNQMFLVI